MIILRRVKDNEGLYGLLASGFLILVLLTGCASLPGQEEFQQGLELFKAREYTDAHSYALAAYKKAPDKKNYMGLLGWTYLKQGRLEEAEQLFGAIYEKDEEDISALQGGAWVKYSSGHYDEAKDWFKKEFDWGDGHINSENFRYYGFDDRNYVFSIVSDANYGLGLTSVALGDLSLARDHLQKALKVQNDFTGHGPIKGSLGDVFYYQGKYEVAAKYYKEALEYKEDEVIRQRLAWCMYFAGDNIGAEKHFEQGMKKAKDHRPFLYGLVSTNYAQGKTVETEAHLRELIKLDPYFADTIYLRQMIGKTAYYKIIWKIFGREYFDRGDYEQALLKLDYYLTLAKEDCESQLMKAWCHVYLGPLTTALSIFDKLSSREECPKGQAMTGRGVALLYLGRLNEARTLFKEAKRFDPKNVRAKVALGAVAFLEGNYEEAIKIYTANLHLLPKKESFFSWPSHAINNLGWSYLYTRRYKEALEIFKRLETYHRRPIYALVYNGLGWAYFYVGRFEEAKEAFNRSLKLYPNNSAAREGLSTIAHYGK